MCEDCEIHNEKPPETIYVQWMDDKGDLIHFTWHVERVYKHDIEYRAVVGEEHDKGGGKKITS